MLRYWLFVLIYWHAVNCIYMVRWNMDASYSNDIETKELEYKIDEVQVLTKLYQAYGNTNE